MKLLSVIVKNFKVVLRNWTSVLLLVLGPMLLILLIGIAFSGDELTEINIGYYAKSDKAAQALLINIATEKVNLMRFGNIAGCIDELKRAEVHICVEFSDDFSAEEATGSITFHYDNSRFNLVKSILAFINSKVAITAEAITLETTTKILGDIQTMVVFLQGTRVQLDELRKQALETKQEMIEMRAKLWEIKLKFEPKYKNVKQIQTEVNVHSSSLFASKRTLSGLLVDLDDLLVKLDLQLAQVIAANLTTPTLPSSSVTGTNQTILNLSLVTSALIQQVRLQIQSVQLGLDRTENDTIDMLNAFNDGVKELDDIHDFLNESIVVLDEHIILIDRGLVAIEALTEQLDKQIVKFAGISETEAEKLVKPITSFYQQIIDADSTIFLLFPVLLAFVTMFISILLSNMVVLNEIHSAAFFRNFLLPVNNLIFVLGVFLTNLIVILFQIAVLLAVGFFKFSINVVPVLGPLVVEIILVASIFVLVGMIIAYLARNRQTSILIAVFVSLAFFLFSDIIFPIEIMPAIAGVAASYNPLVLGEALFRRTLLFGIGLEGSLSIIWALLIYLVILSLFAVLSYYYSKYKR